MTWYGRNRRALPWRAGPGERADPYRVWLSEIMLQQTTVAAVEPYFERFVRRWPDVHALARAELDEVLHAWQGLGYYARARNLHACARVVARDLKGRFPESEEALRRLPGIGPYTAAAIAAIAFGRPATVVDGNVERLLARLYAVSEPLPGARPRLRQLAAALAPERRPGDFAQAAMDLGALVCTPRAPACGRCPWAEACAARALGLERSLPCKLCKPARPRRHGVAFWLEREDGAVWLRRRHESGLLGGMMEVPSTEWRDEGWSERDARAAAPAPARWESLPGVVHHTFTHFHLEIRVLAARVALPGRETADTIERGDGGAAGAIERGDGGGIWAAPERLPELALPTVMKKIIRHATAQSRRLLRARESVGERP